MRPSIVAPMTFVVAALLLAGLQVACSGADPQDVLESTPTPAATSGAGNSSGSAGNAGAVDAGADVAAPETSTACTPEVEPNDGRERANTLAPSVCGTIEPSGESDFLTFQLSPRATALQLEFDGQVTLKVEVDGDSVTLGGGKFPAVPFRKGKRYFIEIEATERAASVPWRVDLIEK